MTGTIRRPTRRGCLGLLILAGVLVFCGLILTVLLAVTIWPGEVKLTAPLLCSEDKTDAYVVVDRHRVSPGETSYDFSLYCMGPRGSFENVGFGAPFFILSVFHTGLLCIVAMVFLRTAARRRRHGPNESRPLLTPRSSRRWP